MAKPRQKDPLPARRPLGLFGAHDPFTRLREEMDEVLGRYFAPARAGSASGETGAFGMSPTLDLSETEKQVTITLDAPGMDENDFDITLADGGVLISGSREHETEEDGENFHRIERSYGSFRRHVPLPCDVQEDKVEARLKKGVLKIKLPKSDKARAATRKIAIKTS